jgi:tetratricopeptide (TPR) repeat protein
MRSAPSAAVAWRNVRAAADLLSRAAALQPEFYEVWRVSAYAKERSGDILGAQVDFARAVELADGESEPLLVHYAHFLRRQEDFSAAVEILKDRALRDDASPALVASYGWMLALSGDPERAVQQYDRIKGELLRFGFDGQRQLLTKYIEVMRREAEVRQRQNRYEDALRVLQRALAIAADAIGFGLLDAQLVHLAQDCASMSFSCLARRYDEQSWVSISQMLVAMCTEFEVVPEAKRGYLDTLVAAQPAIKADPAYAALSRPIEPSQLLFGSALTPLPSRDYTFIRSDDGQDYFFHRSALINPSDWEQLYSAARSRVRFRAEEASQAVDRNPKAFDVLVDALPEV